MEAEIDLFGLMITHIAKKAWIMNMNAAAVTVVILALCYCCLSAVCYIDCNQCWMTFTDSANFVHRLLEVL